MSSDERDIHDSIVALRADRDEILRRFNLEWEQRVAAEAELVRVRERLEKLAERWEHRCVQYARNPQVAQTYHEVVSELREALTVSQTDPTTQDAAECPEPKR